MRRAEELRYLILAAQREGNRLLAHELRPLGITTAQAEVIRVLHDNQPLTLNGLGELLICETSTSPSRLVDRMVTAGLVARRPSEQDRRTIELTLTNEGAHLATQVVEIENGLYQMIDSAAGQHDLEAVTGFLHAFLAGTTAGEAITRRLTATQSDSGNYLVGPVEYR